jgi:CDP-paratose synthetase
MTVKRLFDYMAESLDAPEPVDMTKGEQVLDFIHVDDVAGFFAYTVAHADEFLALKENGAEFHLGTGKGTSIREVAALMEEISGKKCNIHWGGRAYRERDIMHAVAPVEKNACGWKAEISLKDGIKRMLKK